MPGMGVSITGISTLGLIFLISYVYNRKKHLWNCKFQCMSDVHNSKTRSYNMSRIRGKDTRPEIIVRKFLHQHGYRYRLHDKKLPGKPDIVLRKYQTVIFVHGCFWHGHGGCKYFVVPKSRTEFWLNKIETNKRNDDKNYELLKQNGWTVHTIWECELKKGKIEATLEKLVQLLGAR